MANYLYTFTMGYSGVNANVRILVGGINNNGQISIVMDEATFPGFRTNIGNQGFPLSNITRLLVASAEVVP